MSDSIKAGSEAAKRTDGIATATSTSNLIESFAFTAVLVAQLPARTISVGASNATFQLTSSVGSGRMYGTAMFFLDTVRDAWSGCCGGVGCISMRTLWRESRKASSGWER